MDETPQPTDQEKVVPEPVVPVEPVDSVKPAPVIEAAEMNEKEITSAPSTPATAYSSTVRYGGFGIRFGALFIDAILLGVVITPILKAVFPADSSDVSTLSNTAYNLLGVLSTLYYVLLTGLIGATLGKKILKIKVVGLDGNKPSWGAVLMREIVGKFVSGIVFMLGFIWVAFDKEKQGWHDKIAHTHVVYK